MYAPNSIFTDIRQGLSSAILRQFWFGVCIQYCVKTERFDLENENKSFLQDIGNENMPQSVNRTSQAQKSVTSAK